ncbi:hypothetical protein [Kibdelosporangium aridum]|uniref:hypothetical protein n=1 Tax=Kibdelosporangium aridum TaxID=2030 RepID=UPI000F7ABC01|nr:hypothetical protein [Kibdelosporangium aridum]
MIVTELIPATEVVDHADMYLEVNLRFSPQPEHHLRYCYFEDLEGGPGRGYVEVGFTEETGAIAEVVVITRPAWTGKFPADVPVVDGSIRVDRGNWDVDPRINFIRERGAHSVSTKDKMVYYAVSGVPPAKFVRSGPVGFGLGEAGELTGFVTGLT